VGLLGGQSMNVIFVILIALAGVPADPPKAPSCEAVQGAENVVRSRVGDEFFERYFRFDQILRKERGYEAEEFGYMVIWAWHVDSPVSVRAKVVVVVDREGKDVTLESEYGLPDCVENPGECEFPIDMESAEERARDAGLEPGLGRWNVKFLWSQEYGTYVWSVSNWIVGITNKRRGVTVFVDANDGRVLGPRKRWGPWE
jgi:hypothetical protein